MSLINEALKKAQRQRAETTAGPDATPGGPIQKRGAPMRAQTMILLTAAAVTLVVCSVVATVYLVNRKPDAPARPAAAAPIKLPAVDPNAPSPVIVAPVLPKPAPESAPNPATLAATESAPKAPAAVAAAPVHAPAPTTPASAGPAASPAPVAAAVPPVAAPAKPKPSAPPDPRILAFVDAIKVAGIRSSGSDSKVLMNDRVFRVNEIVERTLEVKLVKVQSDALTFEDANGVIYTKNF